LPQPVKEDAELEKYAERSLRGGFAEKQNSCKHAAGPQLRDRQE
jgi:hypothetical protein